MHMHAVLTVGNRMLRILTQGTGFYEPWKVASLAEEFSGERYSVESDEEKDSAGI